MVQTDYEPLNKVIFRGKFYDISLVRSAKTRETLALTKFRLKEMSDRTILNMTFQQSGKLKQLLHPSILQFHDSFFDELDPNIFFTVNQYCEYGTVGARLLDRKKKKEGSFPSEVTLKWAAQLLSAVYFLHTQSIIHGDIKPDNLHIGLNKDIKLGDLETMKLTRTVTGTTDAAIGGTPAYMAPEKIEGKGMMLSDEWSVGATLFHIATLELPFGQSFPEIVSKMQTQQLTVQIAKIKSPDLEKIISRLLVHDFRNRLDAQSILQSMPSLKKYLATSKYTLNEELGRGSFGIVYKVTCNHTNQIFVMKRIDKSSIEPDEYAKIKQEIIALRLFNHPNIVGHQESFEDSLGYCIIMEYCGGGTLGTEIKARKKAVSGPFADDQILKWGGQLMEAIAYIHDQKVMHRDIKPDNVLLSATKDVKLGDFGGVKIAATGGRAQTVIGTAIYMAPDMISAVVAASFSDDDNPSDSSNGTYPPEVDEWSAGVVIFELATLRVPITAKHLPEMFRKLQENKLDVPFSEIKSDTIRGLVEKLLVFDAKQRYKANDMIPLFKSAGKTGNPPAILHGLRSLVKTASTESLLQLKLEELDPVTVYEELREMRSNGTFGRSSCVRDRQSGATYFLKVRSANLMGSQREAIQQEVSKIASLGVHRNIINYKRHFLTPTKSYGIVIEFIINGSLDRAIRMRKNVHYPEADVLNMAAQLISALLFLHDERIVHRDINTSNIFVKDSKGWIKLGDVGVALEQLGVTTLLNAYPNKAAYLAPEILVNPKNAAFTASSDMWSLGCVLHEVCTLKKTFQETNVTALIEKIQRAQCSPLPPAAKYSAKVDRLIANLLDKDPGKRKSSKELAALPELIRVSAKQS